MRITGRRADGAIYLSMGFGLAVILKGPRVTPTLDESVVETLGPWTPAENSFETRRAVQRALDLARVSSMDYFYLAKAVEPEIEDEEVEDEEVEDEAEDEAPEDDAEGDTEDDAEDEDEESDDEAASEKASEDKDKKPVAAAVAKKGEVVLPAPEDVAVIPEDEEDEAVDAGGWIKVTPATKRLPKSGGGTGPGAPRKRKTQQSSAARSLDVAPVALDKDEHGYGSYPKDGAKSEKARDDDDDPNEYARRQAEKHYASPEGQAERQKIGTRVVRRPGDYIHEKDPNEHAEEEAKKYWTSPEGRRVKSGMGKSLAEKPHDCGCHAKKGEPCGCHASTILLDNTAKFRLLLASTTRAKLITLDDKSEHPFQWCIDHVVPAMEAEGKGPDDPNAFCAYWKAEKS